MKKRISLTLALALVLIPLVAILSAVSVSAAALGRSYDIYQSSTPITVDGNASEWESVAASEAFANEANTNASMNNGLNISYKALWEETDDREKINVFYMIRVEGGFASVVSRLLRVNMKSNNTAFQTDSIGILASVGLTNKSNNTMSYSYAVEKQADGTVILEAMTTVAKPSDGIVSLNIWYREYGSWTTFQQASWNQDGDYGATGHGILKNEVAGGSLPDDEADVLLQKDGQVIASLNKDGDGNVILPDYTNFKRAIMLGWKDAAGKLWPVGATYAVEGDSTVTLDAMVLSVELLPGAAILIEDPTALRFDASMDTAMLEALGDTLLEKGAMLTKTSDLNAAITQDGLITPEELQAANVAFERIALSDSDEEGLYSAVLENITDVTMAYSATAYVTVKYADGSEKTYSAPGYSMADHSRSVKAVAEAAYADRSNLRNEVEGVKYLFKVSKNYAVGDFTLFSYSPYTEEQLDLLAVFKQ